MPAPKNVNATVSGSSTIYVSWSVVSNASGYVIEYATDKAFTTGIGTVNSSTNSATLTSLKTSTLYYVRVMATGTGEYADSEWSAADSATTLLELATPTLSVTQTGSNTISVTWSAVSNASHYVVQYTTDETFTTGINSTDYLRNNSVTLTGLKPNTVYYVRVVARGDQMHGNSDYSAPKSATTLARPVSVTGGTEKENQAAEKAIEEAWKKVETQEQKINAHQEKIDKAEDDEKTKEKTLKNLYDQMGWLELELYLLNVAAQNIEASGLAAPTMAKEVAKIIPLYKKLDALQKKVAKLEDKHSEKLRKTLDKLYDQMEWLEEKIGWYEYYYYGIGHEHRYLLRSGLAAPIVAKAIAKAISLEMKAFALNRKIEKAGDRTSEATMNKLSIAGDKLMIESQWYDDEVIPAIAKCETLEAAKAKAKEMEKATAIVKNIIAQWVKIDKAEAKKNPSYKTINKLHDDLDKLKDQLASLGYFILSWW
jgi:hypothetical protein